MSAIAIVGMACRFPRANDLEQYWDMLCRGEDAITEIPYDRWDIDKFYSEDISLPGKMNTSSGGFIENPDRFDAAFFNISEIEAQALDPQQRLLLETTWQALENAAILPSQLASTSCGVFIGVMGNEWSHIHLNNIENIDVYTGVGNGYCLLANRISYQYNLKGMSMAIDTACSSSLVAVDMACKAISNGSISSAIVGGVNIILTPALNIFYTKAGLSARDGRCKPFSNCSDGIGRGEGVGIVILKPLEQAIKDKNNIYAVIEGSAVNHGGQSNGITSPNRWAQEEVLKEAYKQAKISPKDVQYIEAHGTGTLLGDPIEATALGAVFGKDREVGNDCLIGSVKSNVGHLEGAAGIAGLIKTALAIKYGKIPPTLFANVENQYINFSKLKLRVQKELTDWPCKKANKIAGVSSFGLGGTNAHIVMREFRTPHNNNSNTEKYSILKLSAKSLPSLKAIAKKYSKFLSMHGNWKDIVFTANTAKEDFNHRLIIRASNKDELESNLQTFVIGQENSNYESSAISTLSLKKIIWMFPGQGDQHPGMGRKLYEVEPVFKNEIDKCDLLFKRVHSHSLLEIMFSEDKLGKINQTIYTQPALFAFEYALSKLWQSWGIQANYLIGHSIGEYVAASLSGVMDLEAAFLLVCQRAILIQEMPEAGTMLAVFCALEELQETIVNYKLDIDIDIAANNCSTNTVVSGLNSEIGKLTAILDKQKILHKALNTSHAFHSKLLKPAADKFHQFLQGFHYNKPNIPIFSNLSGHILESIDAEYWTNHLLKTVRFQEGIEESLNFNIGTYLEVGPSQTLTSLCKKIIAKDKYLILPSLSCEKNDECSLLDAFSKLYLRGHNVDWHSLNQHKNCQIESIPSYQFTGKSYWHREINSPSKLDVSTDNHLLNNNENVICAEKTNKNYINDISAVVERIVGIPLAELSIDAEFDRDYGIDSLMLLKLKLQLDREIPEIQKISIMSFSGIRSIKQLNELLIVKSRATCEVPQ